MKERQALKQQDAQHKFKGHFTQDERYTAAL